MPTAFVALDDRVLGVDVDRPDTTETLAETSPECIAASPAVPERLFLGTVDSGLLRSDDGGDTWRNVLVAGDRVTAVIVSPNDPDVVWAGTEPSAVYRSTDGGDSWQDRPSLTDLPSASSWSFPPRPHTHHVRWLAEAPTDHDTLYVAIEAGALVRTHDGGETWLDRPSGSRRDTHTMATHPAEPDRLYVAAGDGYAESRDCGDTWLYPQDGLDHRYVWSVAVAPDDPETVVVSAANGPRQAHTPSTAESYLYRRTDGGPWKVAMDGVPRPAGTVRGVLATGERDFFVATNHGLFRSPDGARWRAVDDEWGDAYGERVPRGLTVV
ncbi:hypothetical protein QA599_20765 [Haloarculaceae archaeon H-GB1-1]|nr:hypothetical protein [Haloarculaceae archaeon H-GB1-1]